MSRTRIALLAVACLPAWHATAEDRLLPFPEEGGLPPQPGAIAQPDPLAPDIPDVAPNTPADVHPLATPGEIVYDPRACRAPGEPAPFRTTPLALEPHWGDGLPSRGYDHYDADSEHYGIWYRPTSFGRGPRERCSPPAWNPRGYGDLFARSSAFHRMDYSPYVLCNDCSDEGPAYHPERHDCCYRRSLLQWARNAFTPSCRRRP